MEVKDFMIFMKPSRTFRLYSFGFPRTLYTSTSRTLNGVLRCPKTRTESACPCGPKLRPASH